MLAGTAEVFTVTVPAWLLAALAFLGTVLGGAISFAVNQLLIKGAADRAAKKREKEDAQHSDLPTNDEVVDLIKQHIEGQGLRKKQKTKLEPQ